MKKKKAKKSSVRKFFSYLSIAGALAIFCFAILFFLIVYKSSDSIYVSSENPRQGETVFIRVKSESGNITGSFKDEKLNFFKKGNLPEWVAFLGIDADKVPGDYKILVNTSSINNLSKDVKISLADFSSSLPASAPSFQQTGISNEKAVENIVKNDNPALKKILSNFTPAPYFRDSFSFPLGSIKETGISFGKFIDFAKEKIQHLGVDLRAPEDTNIYAINDGKVVATLNLSNYGKTVIIDHGIGIFSLYLHLDKFNVAEGQMVKRGQNIGLSGDTGYTTAPHLHFSIRVNGARVDPIAFIETSKKLQDSFILADISVAFLNLLKQ